MVPHGKRGEAGLPWGDRSTWGRWRSVLSDAHAVKGDVGRISGRLIVPLIPLIPLIPLLTLLTQRATERGAA